MCLQQVSSLSMARALTQPDTESTLVSPGDSVDSMHSLDALLPPARDSSIHTVQNWLASNEDRWSRLLSLDSATQQSAIPVLDANHMHAKTTKHHAETVASQLSSGANQLIPPDASMQSTDFEQSIVAEFDQQGMVEPADQHCLAEAASQQMSTEAAQQQRAVHALVKRFEHMTVAKHKPSKQAVIGPGLQGSSVDQASGNSTSAKKVHWMSDGAAGVATLNGAGSSKSDADARLSASREIESQPSFDNPTLQGRLIDLPFDTQPSKWLLNTAFESENLAEEAARVSATSDAGLAEPDAAGPGCNPSQFCIEEPVTVADFERFPEQGRSWRASRYVCALNAPIANANNYHTSWQHTCHSHSMYSMCVVPPKVATKQKPVKFWHTFLGKC